MGFLIVGLTAVFLIMILVILHQLDAVRTFATEIFNKFSGEGTSLHIKCGDLDEGLTKHNEQIETLKKNFLDFDRLRDDLRQAATRIKVLERQVMDMRLLLRADSHEVSRSSIELENEIRFLRTGAIVDVQKKVKETKGKK